MMHIGIVGLPNVGKSTLFNAITKAGAEAANYPFCTIDPNVGVVEVPDTRLDTLTELVVPKKTVPTAIEFVDIAGLVRGASKGEGLGNKFLSHIREVDALAHVVRCFESSDITHVDGSVSPQRDIETINLELVLADLEQVERRLDRTKKMLKSGDPQIKAEVQLLERLLEVLSEGKSARILDFSPEEQEMLLAFPLLSTKPILYVANVNEEDMVAGGDNRLVDEVRQLALAEGAEVVVVCAKIESELSELDDQDKQEFLADLGLTEPGLNLLVRVGYKLLGLITYFTAGVQEVRAWTIVRGTKAPQAAGKIHTDFEKGFIRAEVVAFTDLVESGSYTKAREKGLVRLEGKEYTMKDGDVVHFRFNV